MKKVTKKDLGEILAKALKKGKREKPKPVNWMRAGMMISLGLMVGAILATKLGKSNREKKHNFPPNEK